MLWPLGCAYVPIPGGTLEPMNADPPLLGVHISLLQQPNLRRPQPMPIRHEKNRLVHFVLAGILWYFLLGWIIHLWSIIDAARYTPPQ